jgi:CBS domain-containing membrane protein
MGVRSSLAAAFRLVGLGFEPSGHLEKSLSIGGGLAGLAGVILIGQWSLGLDAGAGLVASMGASAVLLFAVPHGPLSQPWPVFGGHLVSAVIGVACAKLIAQPVLTAALAVGLAIGAMYYLRCIHPPGGATALSAVVGSEAVRDLGFQYVLTPVLLNVVTILMVALVFNYPFPWRRYPAALVRRARVAPTPPPERPLRTRPPHLANASDATGDADASSRVRNDPGNSALHPADIHRGAYYSNGQFGNDWEVRRVVDIFQDSSPPGDSGEPVAYEVVAGLQRRHRGVVSRQALAAWAHYEVVRNESSWQRAVPPHRAIRGDATDPGTPRSPT